jgi:hypothetical protein
MQTKVDTGTRFELHAADVEVTCTIDDGRPARLGYRDADESREFAAEEIEAARSAIGTQVTVMLENGAADRPIQRFTVVLPEIRPAGDEAFAVTAAAVRTTERSLFGGPRPGPQQSYEALLLDGTASCDPATETQDQCHDWRAVQDLEPPGPARLIVTGTCTFPRAGYTVELRRAEPQGINPADLLLEKVVHEPEGPSAEVLTDVEARYEETTDFAYRTVTILPGGPSIEVQRAL